MDNAKIIYDVPELRDAAMSVCDEEGIEIVFADGPIIQHHGEQVTLYRCLCMIPDVTDVSPDAIRKLVRIIKQSEGDIDTLFLYTLEKHTFESGEENTFIVHFFAPKKLNNSSTDKQVFSDSEMLDFIERHHTLHKTIEFLYVVDGYEATVNWDDSPISPSFKGNTIREAMTEMMQDGNIHRT